MQSDTKTNVHSICMHPVLKFERRSMPYTDEEQPVGVFEIALLLGVEPATVSGWRLRKRLPAPEGHLNKGRTPFWKQGDILAWAAATGRNKKVNTQAVDDQVYKVPELNEVAIPPLEWQDKSNLSTVEELDGEPDLSNDNYDVDMDTDSPF